MLAMPCLVVAFLFFTSAVEHLRSSPFVELSINNVGTAQGFIIFSPRRTKSGGLMDWVLFVRPSVRPEPFLRHGWSDFL